MNYQHNSPSAQPEHLQMAMEIANSLISRLSFDDQNEAVAFICQRIRESRIGETHELQLRMDLIQKSLGGIPMVTMDKAKTI